MFTTLPGPLTSRLLTLAALCAAPLALVACGPNGSPSHNVVTLNYTQLGACNGYQLGDTVTSVGPHAAYVVFRLVSVQNTDSQAQSFTFDPSHLFVNQSPRAYVDSGLLTHFTTPASPVTVPAGATVTIGKDVVVVVSTVASDGASEADQTSYFLLNDPKGVDPPILGVKTNATQTSWPYTPNCDQLTY